MAQPYRWNNALLLVVCALLFTGTSSANDTSAAPALNYSWVNEDLPNDRAELFALRRQYVEAIRHLKIYPDPYEPSDAVFGQVADQEPWARTNGFYITNPQLLITPTPPNTITPIDYWAADKNPPGEQTIQHSVNKTTIRYNGISANHWMSWVSEKGIRLEDVNARDAGFNYAMLDLAASQNIDAEKSGNMVRKPVPFKSFFHYGTNVSANNLSPAYPAMRIKLNDYQETAKLNIKLWRDQPPDNHTAADYTYIIEVFPDPDAADFDVINMTMLEVVLESVWLDILLVIVLPLLLLILGYLIGSHKEKRHYQSIQRRERALLHIPVTTAFIALSSDREIAGVKLVSGATVVSVDYFKRLLAFFRNLIGGKVQAYASLVDRARREAILRMKESSPDSDEFINCRLHTAQIGGIRKRGTACVEVIAYATAIRYRQ